MDEATKVSRGRKKTDDRRLTIAQIAEETGQKYDTVKTQIRRAREEHGTPSRQKGFTEPFSSSVKKSSASTSSALSIKEQQALDKEVQQAIAVVLTALPSASPLVRNAAQRQLQSLLASLA